MNEASRGYIESSRARYVEDNTIRKQLLDAREVNKGEVKRNTMGNEGVQRVISTVNTT